MYSIKLRNKNLGSLIEKETKKKLEELGVLALAELRQATPVDTGAARDSWKLEEVEDGSVRITNDKEYVKQLNAGSSKQAPENFIENTMLSYGKPKGPIVTYE